MQKGQVRRFFFLLYKKTRVLGDTWREVSEKVAGTDLNWSGSRSRREKDNTTLANNTVPQAPTVGLAQRSFCLFICDLLPFLEKYGFKAAENYVHDINTYKPLSHLMFRFFSF